MNGKVILQTRIYVYETLNFGGRGGVRVDVNEELKFLWKFKKKLGVGGGGVGGGGVGRVGGVGLEGGSG